MRIPNSHSCHQIVGNRVIHQSRVVIFKQKHLQKPMTGIAPVAPVLLCVWLWLLNSTVGFCLVTASFRSPMQIRYKITIIYIIYIFIKSCLMWNAMSHEKHISTSPIFKPIVAQYFSQLNKLPLISYFVMILQFVTNMNPFTLFVICHLKTVHFFWRQSCWGVLKCQLETLLHWVLKNRPQSAGVLRECS